MSYSRQTWKVVRLKFAYLFFLFLIYKKKFLIVSILHYPLIPLYKCTRNVVDIVYCGIFNNFCSYYAI